MIITLQFSFVHVKIIIIFSLIQTRLDCYLNSDFVFCILLFVACLRYCDPLIRFFSVPADRLHKFTTFGRLMDMIVACLCDPLVLVSVTAEVTRVHNIREADGYDCCLMASDQR
jgi:hypothetical protein